MRITGGRAKGIPLRVSAASAARPATDRMREAVFSSLGDVVGLRFVDLFAGSGAYGLEAWSRGAAGGVFVERNRRIAADLKANVGAVANSLREPEEAVTLVQSDARRWQPEAPGAVDLVFADPPYEQIPEVAPGLFARVRDWLSPHGRFVFEMPGELDLEGAGWMCLRRIGRGRQQPVCAIFALGSEDPLPAQSGRE